MTTWQDIITAPKDWTDVLVFSPEHEGFNCGGVFSAFYAEGEENCWFAHGPAHNIRLNPTHWQPLPSAPGTTTHEPVAEIERLREAGQFLLDRLVDHEVRMTSDEDAREWFGHVTPAMARFRALIEGTTHD